MHQSVLTTQIIVPPLLKLLFRVSPASTRHRPPFPFRYISLRENGYEYPFGLAERGTNGSWSDFLESRHFNDIEPCGGGIGRGLGYGGNRLKLPGLWCEGDRVVSMSLGRSELPLFASPKAHSWDDRTIKNREAYRRDRININVTANGTASRIWTNTLREGGRDDLSSDGEVNWESGYVTRFEWSKNNSLPLEFALLDQLRHLKLSFGTPRADSTTASAVATASATATATTAAVAPPFTTLSCLVAKVPSLLFLDVSNNDLTAIPSCVGHLPVLKHLNIANNQLITLPRSLGLLSSLHTLNARNNLLKSASPLHAFLQPKFVHPSPFLYSQGHACGEGSCWGERTGSRPEPPTEEEGVHSVSLRFIDLSFNLLDDARPLAHLHMFRLLRGLYLQVSKHR